MQTETRRAEPRRSRISPFVLVVLVCGAAMLSSSTSGCSSGDDGAAGGGADAASDNYATDADPCSAYTAVGKTCSLQPGKLCFQQCQTGGCFCENGVWACRTDFSCYADGSPLDEAGFDEDAGPLDSGTDSTVDSASPDAADATSATDATDATDASDDVTDAPVDAEDAG